MIETRPMRMQERALLIGLEKDGVSKWDLRDSLEELRELLTQMQQPKATTAAQPPGKSDGAAKRAKKSG